MSSPWLRRTLIALGTLIGFIAVAACLTAAHERPLSPGASDAQRDYSGALPVFPGAEGFGTDTPAGRGGALLRVTTLDNSGPGSLRAALETPGPRTIVFEVAGVIALENIIEIREPFLTVAGQTAPTPGITITGAGIAILAHDVLIQHLRIRVGDAPEGPEPGGRDCLSIYGGLNGDPPAERIVIDHCSLSWAIDEGCSTWGSEVRDITFRYCISAENLSHSLHPEGEHSKGLLIGDHTHRISVIGCLFAHNMQRNPIIKGDVSALIANTLIYDPGCMAVHLSDPEGSGPSCVTVLNNVFIPGPSTPWWTPLTSALSDVKLGSRIYQRGNATSRRLTFGAQDALLWLQLLVRRPFSPTVTLSPLTLLSAKDAREAVLQHAGARPAERDNTDTRVVRDVREGTGHLIDTPRAVGGLKAETAVHAMRKYPEVPEGDNDNDGYTNLEEWLHGLAQALEGH